jgi:hypothetical protein
MYAWKCWRESRARFFFLLIMFTVTALLFTLQPGLEVRNGWWHFDRSEYIRNPWQTAQAVFSMILSVLWCSGFLSAVFLDATADANFGDVDTLGCLRGGNGNSGSRSHIPCGGITGDTDESGEHARAVHFGAAHCSVVDCPCRSSVTGADNADDCVAAERERRTDLYVGGGNRVCDPSSNHHCPAAPQSANSFCGTAGLAGEQQPVSLRAGRVSVGIVMARRFPGSGVSAGRAVSPQTCGSVSPTSIRTHEQVNLTKDRRELFHFVAGDGGNQVLMFGVGSP